MQEYLASSRYIDWQHPSVLQKAKSLAADFTSAEAIVRACFEFVRDEIKHSWDYQLNPVTCIASDTLIHGTGFCYAKSHLLAALLRANHIPTGLCYQRLTIANDRPPFCLHGLNAVFLPHYGWYRLDARGNKPGVVAEFCPPEEKLAFHYVVQGEGMFPQIWPEPMARVVRSLESAKTFQEVADNLPDLPLPT
jgi:transglutaminase-like putative cysteine protease